MKQYKSLQNIRLQSLPVCALLLLVLLSGCRTTRQAADVKDASTGYLSSRVMLTVPHKQAILTINGTMKLKSGERMQLSLLMPILRTEVARIDVTPDEMLLVDRMGKRYVQATRAEIQSLLPRKVSFKQLEKLLYEAVKPNGKRNLKAGELGIPQLEKGEIELSDFSDTPFNMQATRLSQKYRRVELAELMEMLISLQK